MNKLVPPELKTIKMDSQSTISMEDSTLEPIKIYGLQRSGTNWLGFLIKENFKNVKVLVNEGGWKHGHYMAPWALKKEVHIASVIKNPYAWLVSVYNYWGPNRKKNIGPDLRGVDFSDFVRNRYLGEQQRGIPFIVRAKNPVQHWNNMNIHWLSVRLNEKRSCFVTYEALMENLNGTLNALGTSLGLTQKYENKWMNNDREFLPGDDKEWRIGTEQFNSKYYRDKEWKKFYTPELLEFVNDELDLDIMVQFGYDFTLPEELC